VTKQRRKRQSPEQRFWKHVDRRADDECWPWTAAKRPTGYGFFWDGETHGGAHRFSWRIANGRPIPAGKVICHSCDNPSCVNPAHLWAGTPKENRADCEAKGRATQPPRFVGVEHWRSRNSHCRHGHPLTSDNVYMRSDGGRRCRQCDRDKHVRRLTDVQVSGYLERGPFTVIVRAKL
jgi:hypothetical protein